MSKKTWTQKEIKDLMIQRNDFLERCILKIYSNQTPDEQLLETTRHSNNRGFNGCDANFMSSLARQILRNTKNGIIAGRRLSEKQFCAARRIMLKYSKQLLSFC